MNLLQKYGIKEVADVTFYSIDDTGRPVSPVLFLDTLKVSTIEQTAEEAEARGGKGNGLLILWDYGKDINVSLEDALFSAKSLAIMFGGGEAKKIVSIPEGVRFYTTIDETSFYVSSPGHGLASFEWLPLEDVVEDGQVLILPEWYEGCPDEGEPEEYLGEKKLIHMTGIASDSGTPVDGWVFEDDIYGYAYIPFYGFWHPQDNLIMKSEFFRATKDVTSFVAPYDWGWNPNFSQNGKSYTKINPLFFSAKGEKVTSLEEGEEYFCTYDLAMSSAQVIEISAKTFPGIYYITGTTYCRNQDSGKDEMFEFIIPKAKVQSENTITLEAEGDPSVFNMNLRVLRDKKGGMMKLVKYELDGGDETEELKSELIHNHQLDGENAPPPPLPILNIDYSNITFYLEGTPEIYGSFLVDDQWVSVSIVSIDGDVAVWEDSLVIPSHATEFQISKQFYGADGAHQYFIELPITSISDGIVVVPEEIKEPLE